MIPFLRDGAKGPRRIGYTPGTMECCTVPTEPAATDLLSLFLLGVTISLGHCIGMCGPFVTMIAAGGAGSGGWGARLLRALGYHGARIAAYALIGGMLGLVGQTVGMLDDARRLQGGLSLVLGLLMVALALHLVGLIRAGAWTRGAEIGRFIGARIQPLIARPTLPRAAALGFANGWLPCGPVYAAAMSAAAAGRTATGSAGMIAFGLGTAPVLIALGLGAGRLGTGTRRLFQRVGGVLVGLLGVQLILRGLAAWHAIGHLRLGEIVLW